MRANTRPTLLRGAGLWSRAWRLKFRHAGLEAFYPGAPARDIAVITYSAHELVAALRRPFPYGSVISGAFARDRTICDALVGRGKPQLGSWATGESGLTLADVLDSAAGVRTTAGVGALVSAVDGARALLTAKLGPGARVLLQNIRRRREWSASPGNAVDPHRILAGRVQYWQRCQRRAGALDRGVHLVVGGSFSASVSTREIAANGAVSLLVASALQRAGYRVGVSVCYGYQARSRDDKGVLHGFPLIRVLEPGARVPLSVLAFWLCSPAALRVLVFSLQYLAPAVVGLANGNGVPCAWPIKPGAVGAPVMRAAPTLTADSAGKVVIVPHLDRAAATPTGAAALAAELLERLARGLS